MGIEESFALLPFVMAGGVLGAVHFGGLWWTIQRLPSARRPAAWMAGSFLLRSSIVLGGFYWTVQSGWPATLAAMAGFIAVRVLFGRRLRPDTSPPSRPTP